MPVKLLEIPGYKAAAEKIVADEVVFNIRKLSNRVCKDGYCAMVAVLLEMGLIADAIGDGLPGEREIVSYLLDRDYNPNNREDVALREEVSDITWRNDRGDMDDPTRVRRWLLEPGRDPGKGATG